MSSEAATTSSDGGAGHDAPTSEPQEIEQESMVAATSTHHGNSVDPKPKSRRNKKKIKIKHLEKKLKILDRQIKKYIHRVSSQYDTRACIYSFVHYYPNPELEEVRHACTNLYKFSALMSLRSRDNVQAKCTELVVIRARMSDLL